MQAAVAYQGGKTRLAPTIVDSIDLAGAEFFYDMCCGCGAVSLELVSRGFEPERIYMCDSGPWGVVWHYIGKGRFSLGQFKTYIDLIPKDPALIQGFMQELSRQPATIDTPYVYLLLQAAAFGGKALWIHDGKWANCSFRSYWLPTETSNRRSPVNPMMPMPATLYERLAGLCEGMQGVNAKLVDCRSVYIHEGSVVYIDPPYQGTTEYNSEFDVLQFAQQLEVPCYVSEGRPLSEHAICLSKGMAKGGISGDRSKAHEEWLSKFNS